MLTPPGAGGPPLSPSPAPAAAAPRRQGPRPPRRSRCRRSGRTAAIRPMRWRRPARAMTAARSRSCRSCRRPTTCRPCRPTTSAPNPCPLRAPTVPAADALTAQPASTTMDGETDLTALAPPPPSSDGPDLAYGAFQRGFYLTAFQLALDRAEAGDVAAQTLIGLIYEGGYGVPQSYLRRLQLVSARRQFGRPGSPVRARHDVSAGPRRETRIARRRPTTSRRRRRRARSTPCTTSPSSISKAASARSIRSLPRTIWRRRRKRAIRTRNTPSPSSTARASAWRLTIRIAAKWLASAAKLGVVAAQVEYAIRLFNGKGVDKDEAAAARWFERAANAGDPIAQNRLARILAVGAGQPADPVDAAKWHFLAEQAGKTDPWLDNFVDGLTSEQRQSAVAAAQRWPAE